MKKLYILRHGQTDYNKQKRVQGRVDIPLNEEGRKQAELVPNILKDKGIEVFYCGHLERARETAKIIANALNISVIEEEMLMETSWGDAEGMLKSEVNELFGDNMLENWNSNDPVFDDMKFPNGETKIETRERILSAIHNIIKNSSANNIGIISHSFVMTQLLIAMKVEDLSKVKNCEIFCINYHDGIFELTKRIAI